MQTPRTHFTDTGADYLGMWWPVGIMHYGCFLYVNIKIYFLLIKIS